VISFDTYAQFESAIIAQDDDDDYEESGYVAVVAGEFAALTAYSHCSCYGTWTAICGSDYSSADITKQQWDWQGTPDELVSMAVRDADPVVTERKADDADCDYDHLSEVYKQVIAWDERGRTEATDG